MIVYRPVKASAPQMNEVVIDPKTGRFTPAGHRRITELWKRTGGFDDDVGALLGLLSISQTSSLANAADDEKTRRIIGDALQQVQGQNVERLRSLFDDFRKTSDTQFAQLMGGLARPPQTRVITFTAADVWRPAPDLRAIQVFAVGGGGGGAGGVSSTNGGGGGGGANYSWATIDPRILPESVTITVGAAGAAGAAGASGGAGGNSTFGSFIAAKGGAGGASAGTGGAANTLPGGLFLGGAGGGGGGGAGVSAPNDCLGCPGGGGGAYYVASPEPGGDGGAGGSRSLATSGGGGTGGIATGGDGGTSATSETYIGPGFGGGGGGTTAAVSGAGGAGFNGAGGGGGAARAGNARAGGAGGAGRVWVMEIY